MKDILLILVVETEPTVKSDDAYYIWILKNFFGAYLRSQGFNDIRIRYRFIYMCGKTNYNDEEVITDIKTEKAIFSGDGSFVVYCFDVDNGTIKNANFINDVTNFCQSNGFPISFANKEIEDVLQVGHKDLSKKERVKIFAKNYPSLSKFNKSAFFTPIPDVFRILNVTNFGCIIDDIIKNL
jgi:hypothetical protein